MAKTGDKVTYHPGTPGHPFVEAIVTKVNEDGSVNIKYPHHAAPDVMATAEQCQWGSGIYQVSGEGAPEPMATPSVDAEAHQELQVAHESLLSFSETLQAQVAALTAERDAALAELAALTATAPVEEPKKSKKE